MRSLRWTSEHSVFVPEIDAQHQEMFRLADELRRAVLEDERPDQLDWLHNRLSEEIAKHLAFEERLMREALYPSFEWHQRQHRTARGKVEELRRTILAGARHPTFEAIEALAAWMRDHTGVADRMAGAYLRNHWRANLCSIC